MPVSLLQRFRHYIENQNVKDWKLPLTGTVAMSLIFLVVTWTITWHRLGAEREIVDRNSRMRQENLAIIISENLSQVLDRGRLLSLASAEWFDGNRRDATNRLSAMRSADRAFLRISLYDAQARRVYASSPDADSETFSHAVGAALAMTMVDKSRQVPLFVSAERVWRVPILFPVIGSDGEVRGVFLVVLDLGYLLGLYQDVDIGRTGAIQILRDTGEEVARARQGGLESTEGRWKTNIFSVGEGRQGSRLTDLFGDGRAYLASFKHMDRYPLVVVISRAEAELQSDYVENNSRFQVFLWMLTVLVLGGTFWIVKAVQVREKLYKDLKIADIDKHKLILQLEEQRRQAFEWASNDSLTGLPNRRLFLELGASHLTRAKRARQHYGLLYIDLDRFKNINDTLGHHVGDLLLQTVASRLSSALRESDVVARIGGDEFTVLLTGLDNVSDMAVIAGKIIDLVSRPCTNLDGHDIQVSPSIGIAVFPRDGHNMETLSRHADVAMYQSKRAGRGRFTFFDSGLNPVTDRQFELEQRLPTAIAENELVLYFQPKVRLQDFQIVGFEALVRWQHPEYGLIQPGEFLPMVELTRLDVALGDWVADACCQQLARWQTDGLELVPVAINVSARQLNDEQLPVRIAACLASYGIAPGLLEVEITESSLVESIETTSKVLRDIEGIGVGIALDDFGNGYSSLAYIRTLPIHVIKIDRSFISNIGNSHDSVIVDSIVTLAHKLKKRVVAEGVELHDQLVHLKTIGCDEIQGYLMSRPVSANGARQLIVQKILLPPK